MRGKYGVALVLIFCLTLTGCWDLEEVDYRSFVTAIGIDTGKTAAEDVNSAPDKSDNTSNQVILTVQIPLIAEMLPPGARGSGKMEKNYHTASVRGDSVFGAFRVLQTKTYRHVVIQQNKLVVLGEAVARRGVTPVVQWLERSAKHPPQALVFIAHSRTAREILTAEPVSKNMPGLDFGIAKEIDTKQDLTYFIPIWSFREKLINQTEDAYAPLLAFDAAEGQYVTAGLAVFNGTRMAGELTAAQTQAFGLLTGKMRAGGMSFRMSSSGARKFSLRNVSAHTGIKVLIRKGQPFFRITTKIRGSINELIGFDRELSLKMVGSLAKMIEKETRARMVATIHRLQQLNSDPIDFGEELRVQHPEQWERRKWKKVFPTVPFQVTVKASIVRDGVLR